MFVNSTVGQTLPRRFGISPVVSTPVLVSGSAELRRAYALPHEVRRVFMQHVEPPPTEVEPLSPADGAQAIRLSAIFTVAAVGCIVVAVVGLVVAWSVSRSWDKKAGGDLGTEDLRTCLSDSGSDGGELTCHPQQVAPPTARHPSLP